MIMYPLRTLFVTVVATVLTMAPLLATAGDDTEIFFTRKAAGNSVPPNVMFMFDTSGSMSERDSVTDNPGQLRRITRVKKAMIDVVNEVEGVNVGIGRFNGSDKGGAILYPATDPDTDVCPDAVCDTITVNVPVRSGGDDVEETPAGSVFIDSSNLDMTQVPLDAISKTTVSIPVLTGSDDADQLADGTLYTDRNGLRMFYAGGTSPTKIGLRFQNVNIPAGATVLSARIRFKTVGNGARGTQTALIRIDETDNSPTFANVNQQRVADRPLSPAADGILWEGIPWKGGYSVEVDSPDLSGLINKRIANSNWDSSEALTFVLEAGGAKVSDIDNRRGYRSFEANGAPQLELSYTTAAVNHYAVGLRFNAVDIPRGATIKHAYVQFMSQDVDSTSTQLTIKGHKVGNSPVFTNTPRNLTSRARTTASADWPVPPWNKNDQAETTTDIGKVIEELVKQPDWCGGNALSLIIEGNGRRRAAAAERGPWTAPVLKVEYDPGSVDFLNTCISQQTGSQITRSVDDVMESTADGAVSSTSDTLTTVSGTDENVIGLRFGNIQVPQGATVTDAYIELTSAGSGGSAIDIDITGDDAAYSSAFTTSQTNDVSKRTDTGAVSWTAVPAVASGEKLRTPDLSSIVSTITGKTAWSKGNPMTFMLLAKNSGGERLFNAYDDDDSKAARLHIRYQRSEAMPSGSRPVLRTARQEMVDTLLDLQYRGSTPLVDSYYEAAAYMLGKPVFFGKTRGGKGYDDRFFRTSVESSWTGGTFTRPPDCKEVDLDNVACTAEEISGSPVYTAPATGTCQANQIVLLSDGQSTKLSAEPQIKALTGLTNCAVQRNISETCGVELATWLSSTDHNATLSGTQSIVTHTVGFNFSSPFLDQIATAGGGKVYSAASAQELTSVFRNIITEAADLNTSFVAPSATVSQFNRLSNRDDVYYGMFKPSTATQWDGNLKGYKIGVPTGGSDVAVIDQNGDAAFNKSTGQLDSGARSRWSTEDDGANVGAGGAASKLSLTRSLKTYLPGTTTLVDFGSSQDYLSKSLLGIPGADDAYRVELLKWASGVDVKDYDGDGDTTEVRAQMGDPMHSTPYIVNYPSTVDNQANSLVFIGTNQGFLHAIDSHDGTEKFAFIPHHLLSNLDTFYKNATIASGADRPYGLDGTVTGWVQDDNNNLVVDPGEKALVYVGMRRGGSNYYALDVTDPDKPELAWVIEGGKGDFAELGQTWSRPVRTQMKVNNVVTDVLIFSAGYDPAHDTQETRSASGDFQGKGLFFVNATTGAYIDMITETDFTALKYSMPGTPRVIDINGDRLADTIYVGDMGGQLWRFDIDTSATGSIKSAITGGVIAEIGNNVASGNRRFFNEPDVALVADDNGKEFLTISIGTGWRSHPLDSVVEDRFYVIRDYNVYGPPRNAAGDINYSGVRVTETDLFDATTASASTDTGTTHKAGFYIDLSGSGEKVLSAASTVDHAVYFTTYLPDSASTTACTVSVGGGKVYALDVLYGNPVLNLDDGTASGSGTTGGALELADRSKLLQSPGIPPAVSVLLIDKSTTTDPDAGTASYLGVGAEPLDGSGNINPFNRTFWAETTD